VKLTTRAEACTFAEQYRGSPQVVELVYFAWAQVFMAGLNAADVNATGRARDLSSMANDEQKGYLRSYCDAHPLSEYSRGAAFPLSEVSVGFFRGEVGQHQSPD